MPIICFWCNFEGEQGICKEDDEEQDDEEEDEEEEKEQDEEEEEEEEEDEAEEDEADAGDDEDDDDDNNEEDKAQEVEDEKTVTVDGVEVTTLLEMDWMVPARHTASKLALLQFRVSEMWFGRVKFEVCRGVTGVTVGREEDEEHEDGCDNEGENEVELEGIEIEADEDKIVWADWRSDEGVRTVCPKCNW